MWLKNSKQAHGAELGEGRDQGWRDGKDASSV